jgi:hypothetical protein
MADNLFVWACKEIETAEIRLGHRLSWRFLTTPSRTLSSSTDIAFISQNPGVSEILDNYERESSEKGSAYICEKWKWNSNSNSFSYSYLQEQVQELFRQIAETIHTLDYQSLMNKCLMAYYIPFRSPDFESLNQPKESQNFAFRLWSHIMQHISPELIICNGKIAFDGMHRILATSNSLTQTDSSEMRTGWGTYTASINCYTSPKRHVVLVRFPHLSRFKIFDRPESAQYTRKIVSEMTKFMR